MTEPTRRVLASIDDAINGYVSEDDTVSYDAMRWSPEEPQKPNPGRAYWAPPGTLDEGPAGWMELGRVAGDGLVPGGALSEHADAARRLNETLNVVVRANVQAVSSAFGSLKVAFGRIASAFGEQSRRHHVQIAPRLYAEEFRWHRRSCRLCNPAGNPKPLRVNGADYRRRTRARKRRNRR